MVQNAYRTGRPCTCGQSLRFNGIDVHVEGCEAVTIWPPETWPALAAEIERRVEALAEEWRRSG